MEKQTLEKAVALNRKLGEEQIELRKLKRQIKILASIKPDGTVNLEKKVSFVRGGSYNVSETLKIDITGKIIDEIIRLKLRKHVNAIRKYKRHIKNL